MLILRPGIRGAVEKTFCLPFAAGERARDAYGSNRGRHLSNSSIRRRFWLNVWTFGPGADQILDWP
jgi:hypothetical protein